jgi:hypothetical protein
MDTSTDHTTVVIVAGSNLDKERCMPEAIRRLRRHPDVTVRSVSTCFESPSVGGPAGAPEFFNAAIVAIDVISIPNSSGASSTASNTTSVGCEPMTRTHRARSTSTSPSTAISSRTSMGGQSLTRTY